MNKLYEIEKTADESDLASRHEELALTTALANQKLKAENERRALPKPVNGLCAWCEDAPNLDGGAFCSSYCAEDFEKHKRLRGR